MRPTNFPVHKNDVFSTTVYTRLKKLRECLWVKFCPSKWLFNTCQVYRKFYSSCYRLAITSLSIFVSPPHTLWTTDFWLIAVIIRWVFVTKCFCCYSVCKRNISFDSHVNWSIVRFVLWRTRSSFCRHSRRELPRSTRWVPKICVKYVNILSKPLFPLFGGEVVDWVVCFRPSISGRERSR